MDNCSCRFIFILCYIARLAVICSGKHDRGVKPPPELPSVVAKPGSNGRTFIMSNYEFTFVEEKKTWDAAMRACPEMFPKSKTAEFNDRKLVPFVSSVVAEHPELIKKDDKLWIGGAFDGTSWLWEESGVIIPSKMGPDSYPPWTNEMASGHENCLAIEKFETDCRTCSIVFNGGICEEQHGFICMLEKEGNYRRGSEEGMEQESEKEREEKHILLLLFPDALIAAKNIKDGLI